MPNVAANDTLDSYQITNISTVICLCRESYDKSDLYDAGYVHRPVIAAGNR